MTLQGALAGITSGAAIVLIWLYAPFTINGQAPSDVIYEIVPGFIISTIAVIAVSRFGKAAPDTLEKNYNAMLTAQ